MSYQSAVNPEQVCDRTQAVWSLAAVLIVAVVSLPGCGGRAEARLDDYLEELEFDASFDLVKEVQLGSYRVPIAARQSSAYQQGRGITWMQLKFNLFAVVAPEDESALRAAWERHQGMFNDTVLSTCRQMSLEDISDPRLAALKSRLTDLARPILGENRVRQILLNDIVCEPL